MSVRIVTPLIHRNTFPFKNQSLTDFLLGLWISSMFSSTIFISYYCFFTIPSLLHPSHSFQSNLTFISLGPGERGRSTLHYMLNVCVGASHVGVLPTVLYRHSEGSVRAVGIYRFEVIVGPPLERLMVWEGNKVVCNEAWAYLIRFFFFLFYWLGSSNLVCMS